MNLETYQQDGVCVAQATGRIDTITAKPFGEQLVALIEGGARRLVIDMSRVAYISSAGFRSLLVTARGMERADGRLALAGVNGEIRRLFDIAALTEFFPMWATTDEAVAGLAQGGNPGSATAGRPA